MSYVNVLLDINDYKTCNLGSILIDTNGDNVYNGSLKEVNNIPLKNHFMFHPLIYNFINDNKFCLLNCWNNGFIPKQKGLLSPEYCDKNIDELFKNFKITTSDQIFKIRPDERWMGLLHCFKHNNIRFSPQGDTGKLIDCGMICNGWILNGIDIRYIAHLKGNENTKDYVYFIGGSDDIFNDDDVIIENIKKQFVNFLNIKKFKAESPWIKSESIDQIIYARLYKMIYGIINIRNYLKYTIDHLSVNIKQCSSYADTIIFEDIDINDLYKKYDKIYMYCRNICFYIEGI